MIEGLKHQSLLLASQVSFPSVERTGRKLELLQSEGVQHSCAFGVRVGNDSIRYEMCEKIVRCHII